MAQYFVTSRGSYLSQHDEEWKEVRSRFEARFEAERATLPKEAFYSLMYYGRRRYGVPRDESLYDLGSILRPAGGMHAYRLVGADSNREDVSVGFWARQLEIARHGFPDLFEAALFVVDPNSNQAAPISKLMPVTSIDEAQERFSAALASPFAEEVAKAFPGDPRARVFGVASSPVCLNEALAQVPFSTDEINRAASRMNSAAAEFLQALEELENSEVGAYLDRRKRLSRCRMAVESALGTLPQPDPDGALKKGRGRPKRGGHQLVVAHALAELWARCGLGEPKLSPQSRFIRACSIALPRLGVYKADVSQFMRGELSKPQPNRY